MNSTNYKKNLVSQQHYGWVWLRSYKVFNHWAKVNGSNEVVASGSPENLAFELSVGKQSIWLSNKQFQDLRKAIENSTVRTKSCFNQNIDDSALEVIQNRI